MKNLLVPFIILLFVPLTVFGQQTRHKDKGPMKKIEELEKIKLIDALGMDEETTLRFFARRAKFKDEQRQLFSEENNIVEKMQDAVQKDKSSNEEQRKLIKQYLDIQTQIINTRQKFINSLSDILSYQQIAKLIVFEKKFREEIRNLFFRDRMRRRP